MYRCVDCDCIFEEPKELKTTYESYYGVCNEFNSNTPLTIYLCPSCDSDYIEENFEVKENEEDEF